jgi:hypothetical protein
MATQLKFRATRKEPPEEFGISRTTVSRPFTNLIRSVWCLIVLPKFKGVFLNDVFLVGPDLLTSQIGVLLRFRQRPVAVVANISGMYHQVEVSQGQVRSISAQISVPKA